MNENRLQEALNEKDQQLADWMARLADTIACARDLYWRGDITNVSWQETLDAALLELRRGANILRTRPFHVEVKR